MLTGQQKKHKNVIHSDIVNMFTVSPETPDIVINDATSNVRSNIDDLFPVVSETPNMFIDRTEKPSFSFTINKKVITVDGSTDSMLERSAHLISKFVSLGTLGLWEEYSVFELDNLLLKAKHHLQTIIPLYDVSRGEFNAIKEAKDFLQTNEQTMNKIMDEHTGLVISLGIEKAIDHINSKCSYGFTLERFEQWFADDEEHNRLRILVSQGVHSFIPDGFEIQTEVVKPRINQVRLHPVYLACGLKWAMASHALMLHTSKIPLSVRAHMHQNCLSWQVKQEGLGRLCIDKSNHPSKHVLNTDDSKSWADTMWGMCELPSIGSIAHNLLASVETSGIPLSEWSCFKEDVTAAFKQIKYSYETTLLTTCSVAENVTIADVRLAFGGNDSAQVFFLLTRAVERAVRKEALLLLLTFALAIFVDDGMGFAPDNSIMQFRDIYIKWWIRACGSDAINAKKSVPPTKYPILIGYQCDFLRSTVRPDDKCLHKLFIVLFCVYKHGKQLSLRDRQSIASMCERTAQCMRGMQAWLGPIHNMCKGNIHQLHTPNSIQRQAIEIFQASLLAVFDRPEVMAVPLSYVARMHLNTDVGSQYIFRSDASEIAASLSIWSSDGSKLLMWSRVFFTEWGSDSLFSSTSGKLGGSAQNLREFLPMSFMMIMLSNSNLPSQNAVVTWHGDNTSALTWASENRCKANQPASQIAFIAYSLIQRVTEVSLSHTVQMKSADMGTMDLVSRTYDDGLVDWPAHLKVDISTFPTIGELVTLCNPHKFGDLEPHHMVYAYVSDVMIRIKNGIPNGKPKWQ